MKKVLGLVVAGLLLAPVATASADPTFTDGNGLHVVSSKKLDSRLYEVKLDSKELGKPVDMRILLPAGYDAEPGRRWPSLYLFHGTSGRASDWTIMGDAEKTTATSPFITLMPDAGFDNDGGGYFTDWYNAGKGGTPMWETFHIKRLIPWVDANLRTNPTRRARAIYGLSQGGFGSMTYASRHPDLFGAAGAFSGAIDSTADPEAQVLLTPIVYATTVGLDGVADPDAIFGPRTTQQQNWAAHDPATLVNNLRYTTLGFWTGNGNAGPFDGPVANPGATAIEAGVYTLTHLFLARADAAGIKYYFNDYGPGTHSWPYWTRDFQELEPMLRTYFADPPADPKHVTYGSGDNDWSAWGWSASFTRPAREFSTLSDAGIDGFALSGSGSAKIVTPAVYEPGSKAILEYKGTDINRADAVVADSAGRLTIEVPLGPGNPYQQYTPEAGVAGTKVFTTRVSIDGVARLVACPKRTMVVKFGVRRGTALTSVRASVDGRRVASRRGGRRVAVRIGVLSPGSHRVRVVARARVRAGAKARTVALTRTVRCAG